ncbi:hypothetical protein V5T82_14190 [Magnetovibrio sp. PR-2]|uniref:hypothetical protein n=1 Tax=Magnetovibrio sp. PR-2 TaxID=3120356 RepID=UPI002FCE1AD0
MATVNNTEGAEIGYNVEFISQTYDFSATAAGDVIQMLNVQNGTRVLEVSITQAALGGTGTLIVGDGTDPNGYITSTNANTAETVKQNGAYAVGKEYTADDTIDVTVETAAVTGSITVMATIVRTY